MRLSVHKHQLLGGSTQQALMRSLLVNAGLLLALLYGALILFLVLAPAR